MKEARYLSFSLLAGGRSVSARSAASAGVQFQDRAGYGKSLRKAFRGRIKTPSATSTPDGTQILRSRRTGLFNLKSFLGVRRATGSPPASAPVPVTPVPAVQVAASRAAPTVASAAKGSTARDALHAVLPGLSACLLEWKDVVGPASDTFAPVKEFENDLNRVAEGLDKLDALMKSAGAGGENVQALVGALANHARIRELSSSKSSQDAAKGAQGLLALVETMLAAVEPGRDGSQLDAYIGLSGELDPAIKALRLQATANFMLRQAERTRGVPASRLPKKDVDDAKKRAADLVDREFAIARTRRQVERALERSGAARTMGGLSSLKVDAGLVAGLRKSMGGTARDIGIIVGGLLSMQRAISQSPEGRRMLQDVGLELSDKRTEVAQVEARLKQTPPGTEADVLRRRASDLHADIGYLTQRQSALQTEGEAAAVRHDAAGKQADDIEAQIKLLPRGTSQERLAPLLSKLEQTKTVRQYWEARSSSTEESEALTTARQVLSKCDDELARLKSKGTPDEVRGATRNRRIAAKALDRTQRLHVRQHEHGAADLFAGMTAGELRKMGMSGTDSRDVMDAMRSLGGQGLADAGQVGDLLAQIDLAMRRLNAQVFDAGNAFAREAEIFAAGKPEDQARRLGDVLVRNLAGQSGLRLGDAAVPDPIKRGQLADAVKAALMPKLGAVGDPSRRAGLDNFIRNGKTHALKESELADLASRLNAVESNHASAPKSRLRAFNAQAAGRNVKLDRPVGLQACTKMRELIRLCNHTRGFHEASTSPADWDRLNALRNELKGFDPQKLHISRPPGKSISLGELRRLAADPVFTAAVDAVIELRLQEQVSMGVAELDSLVDRRKQAMDRDAPKASDALRDAIRAAILAHLGTSLLAAFRPSDHAAAIIGTLKDWGVPVDAVRPEINLLLSQSFGPDELNLWASQTRAPEADVEGEVEDTKKTLLDSLTSLKPGTKLAVTVAGRVELQSGGIPLEPTGIGSVNVRVATGELHALEIQRMDAYGYELVLKSGRDLKLGLDFSAKLWGLDRAGVSVGAAATVEGSGQRIAGYALRFPASDAGLANLKQTLDYLLTDGRIPGKELQRIDHILPVVESKVTGKLGVSAKAGIDAGKAAAGTLAAGRNLGITAAAQASAGGSVTRTSFFEQSTRQTIAVSETTVTAEISGSLGLGLRVGLPKGDPAGKTHDAATDLLEGGFSRTFIHTTAFKDIRDEYGLLQPGTEVAWQMFAPRAGTEGAMAAMGGPEFVALVKHLKQSRDPSEVKQAEDIAALVRAAGPNDLLRIAADLDPQVREAANAKLGLAKALRHGRADAGTTQQAMKAADKLEDEVQAMLADKRNYIIAKVQIFPVNETVNVLTPLNLVFARVNLQTSSGSFHLAADVKFNLQTVRDVRNQLASQKNA